MVKSVAKVHSAAVALREYSSSPTSSDAPDLRLLITEFVNSTAYANPADPNLAGATGIAALSLFEILQATKDQSIVRTSLGALLCSGRFGRILAVRFIHSKSISLRELAAILVPMPASERLALVHEMLLESTGELDKHTHAWVENIARSLKEVAPHEIVPFIVSLGRTGELLAFPAAQAIASGALSDWIKMNLETGTGEDDLENICFIILALNDPDLAKILAASMHAGIITPTPLALQTISHVTEAGNKPVLEVFLKVLKSNKRLAGFCLDGIIAQQAPIAGKLLATLYSKAPSLRHIATTRAPLLDDSNFDQYIEALPQDLRGQAEQDAFSILVEIAPDFVEVLTGPGLITPQNPEPVSVSFNSESKTREACSESSFLAKFFKRKTKKLQDLLSKPGNIKGIDVSCSTVESEELEGRELLELDLRESHFSNVRFLRTKMAHTQLAKSTFVNGEHRGSTFKSVDFSQCDFDHVVFNNCSFNECDLTNTVFTGCTFSNCRFRNCTLHATIFLDTIIRQSGFTTSILSQIIFHTAKIHSCRFEDASMTSIEFNDSTIAGVEFVNILLLGAQINNSVFHSITMPGSSVHGCQCANADLPHPLFLKNMLAQYSARTRQTEHTHPPTPKTSPEIANKVLRAWSREITFLRREEQMLKVNLQRYCKAMHNMDKKKQVYLRILPHLLHTDVFEKNFSLAGVPPCQVWGYTPGLSALELAKQYFPQVKPSKSTPIVRILAVYAMGSLGSVAQTAQSDIDCWVCYAGDISQNEEIGLRRKLNALELWAESEFGLEAHFFPMRMDDVRANVFSAGDEESSGSAQALLLKEEFYRTALRIAGKHMAWWVTPVGIQSDTYATCIQSIRRYPMTGRPRMEDFGHLAAIPPNEYFGGSLWQMVKAIHSPFKSVLKLGLLETYASPETSHLPLCDQIKKNIFLKRRGVRNTDPYASLFNTLRAYYAKRGDKEAARLLTESFLFKANLCDIPFFMGYPTRSEDASLIQALFGEGFAEKERICNTEKLWTFDKSLKIGTSVRNYMVSTYQRIQETLRDDTSDSLINSEDLTRMGRRIAANFSRKKNKIMRIPFLDAKRGAFPILHLSAEKAPGKKPIWLVRGGSATEAKKSADLLQLLHRSGDPVVMLTWLLANRIYTPKCLLQADRTIAPIAVADLQKLMPSMFDFFPFQETFERDINEGLDEERVTSAFFILNLMCASDTRRIETIAVVYTTNWGEMFCKTFVNPAENVASMPFKFLTDNLDHSVPSPPLMTQFVPKGAQCKRLTII